MAIFLDKYKRARSKQAITLSCCSACLGNPLVVPLESAAATRSKRAKLWFSKPVFESLEMEKDEEEELQQMVRNYESRGGHLWNKADTEKTRRIMEGKEIGSKRWDGGDDVQSMEGEIDFTDRQRAEESGSEVTDESATDSGTDSEDDFHTGSAKLESSQQRDTFEVVPMETRPPVRKLDPEGLAIGALIVQSKKKREDLIESVYNRWTHNDENLPDWFQEDEVKYCQKQLPVTKEMAKEYHAKLKEVNARPIKKVAQAKARKKHRAMKRMERAQKKVENITDAVDVTDHEKVQQIKQIYKKAGVLGKRKRNVQYVVAKKGLAGKRVGRPAGVKGAYRVVDPRMKKDNKTMKHKRRKRTR